jgi:hypothetical protein
MLISLCFVQGIMGKEASPVKIGVLQSGWPILKASAYTVSGDFTDIGLEFLDVSIYIFFTFATQIFAHHHQTNLQSLNLALCASLRLLA